MENDLQEYSDSFLNSVRASATAGMSFTGEAFVEEMSRRLTEAEEVDSLAQGHFEGLGARNKKIGFDGYDFGDQEGHIVLAISHFINDDALSTVTETEANRLFGLVTGFVEAVIAGTLEQLEESSVGYQVAEQLREQLPRTFKIRVYLLTNGVLSSRVKAFASVNIGPVTVEFHPWDIQRIQRVEQSALGREEINIDLTEWDTHGIPCLKAEITSSAVQTYLAVVPGAALAGIYKQYGARVLESNVRSFLSSRASVNKGIRGTLLQQPEMFLSYNNGITATASAVTTHLIEGERRIVAIRDLQIVNGGQTTASIFYAEKEEKGLDLSQVFVQMKMIIVSETEEADIVPRISRYANTQNRISDADFFSNHKFHQRMEEKSRRILAPALAGSPYQTKWFYERTRGQFNTERSRLGVAGARKFETEYPKGQLLTKTDAAKYIVSWSRLPHVVSSGAQKNFVQFAKEIDAKWVQDEDQFGDEYFRHLISKGILFNAIRTRVMKSEWYRNSPGYLANIVTYTIAKLVDIVEVQYRASAFDLDAIWQSQSVSDDLWDLIEPLALAVHRVLTREDRPVLNVTEWAKRERCWDEVRALAVDPKLDFSAFLLSRAERTQAAREDALDQKLLTGIEAQIHAIQQGPEYWGDLQAFGRTIRSLSPRDDSILGVAATGGKQLISEAQAQVLAAIEKRLLNSGFHRKG